MAQYRASAAYCPVPSGIIHLNCNHQLGESRSKGFLFAKLRDMRLCTMVYKDIHRDTAQTSHHIAHMAAVILGCCRTPVDKGREENSGKQQNIYVTGPQKRIHQWPKILRYSPKDICHQCQSHSITRFIPNKQSFDRRSILG